MAQVLQNLGDMKQAIRFLTVHSYESIEAQVLLLNVLLKFNLLEHSQQLASRLSNEDDPLALFSVSCEMIVRGDFEEAMAGFNEL